MIRIPSFRALAAGGLVAVLAACAAVRDQIKSPEVSVGDVRVVGMSLADAQIALDLQVKNPNAFNLPVEGLSYTLKIDDHQLFDGKTGEKLRVDAGKTSKVTLPFTVRYEDVLGSIAALRESRDVRYKVNGKVDFGLLSLPYSKEGKFSLPRLPDISVQSLHVSKMSLDGVELALKLKVNNPNAFPIRLDGINYDLKLAGVAMMHGQSAQPLALEGRDDGITSLRMNVGYKQLGSVLEKLRGAKSMPIEFSSQVKVPGLKEGSKLPYTWSGEVPLVRN